MMKPMLGFAALGVAGLVAVKLLFAVLPLLGLAVGLFVLGLKLLLIFAVLFVLYRVFQKAMRPALKVE